MDSRYMLQLCTYLMISDRVLKYIFFNPKLFFSVSSLFISKLWMVAEVLLVAARYLCRVT